MCFTIGNTFQMMPFLSVITAYARIDNLVKNNMNSLSFTSEMWISDVSPTSILSLTAQWVDQASMLNSSPRISV